MIKFFLILSFLFIGSKSFGDSLKFGIFNNTFQYKSKDKVNKGELEFYSIANPELDLSYSLSLSKIRKIQFSAESKMLNFIDTRFVNQNIYLNSIKYGEKYFFERTKLHWNVSGSEKMVIFSNGSRLSVDKVLVEEFNFGSENPTNFYKNLNWTVDFKFNSLLKHSIRDVETKNGNDFTVGLNYSIRDKNQNFKFLLNFGMETFTTSQTADRSINSIFGLEITNFLGK